jgi:TRAP transporter TAXI family solute receptor
VRVLAALVVLVLAGATVRAQDVDFVSIGTGSVDGVYYPAGRAICRFVNEERVVHGIYCSAEETAGSLYNVTALLDGELDFAFVQSDVQFDAVNGRGAFADKPVESLRSVVALHAEVVTVVARQDVDIGGLADLGKVRVSVGRSGGGARASFDRIAHALGWDRSDRALAAAIGFDASASTLCRNRADALFTMVGHPSPSVARILGACATRLVPVDDPTFEAIAADNPFFLRVSISGEAYGLTADIPSFGVNATIVTLADVPAETVYRFVMATLGNLSRLRDEHPALAELDAREMVSGGLTAPLHPGAERAFRELGLLD